MSCRGDRLSSSCRAQLVSPGQLVRVDCIRPSTSEGHKSLVRTPIWVFLDSMESPLSQESIHILVKDIRCRTEVIDRARHVEVNSSIQVNSSKLIVHDLQLRKVITSPSELRFGCSWTLWKSH